MRLMLDLRGRFARRATLIVIPQHERAEKFQADTGVDPERIRIVYNCPSLSELEEIGPHQKLSHDGLVLWYHGSIGPGQLPPTTVEALARLPEDVELEIAGYETVSSKGYVAQLLARARELGVGRRLRYHGPLPLRSDLLRRAAGAHVGLALFASAFRDPSVGASNKPFDYLACELALLTNRTPEWEGFFGAAGVSIGCDPANADDIARAVLSLRNNPGRRQAMAARGRALIRGTWNYETQFAKVLAVLEPGCPTGARTTARQSTNTERE
jgi:glycosyltransferase involved in cell wall biosynthesis